MMKKRDEANGAMNAEEIVMNERDEEGQSKQNVATPSKQARLHALLFSGAAAAAALMAAVVFLEPKLPRWVGE
jgi:hypothetical protein